MNILIFKTNIRYKKYLNEVVPFLNNTSAMLRWNVDFHDKDRILRIETDNLHPKSVEMGIKQAGYYCEELQD